MDKREIAESIVNANGVCTVIFGFKCSDCPIYELYCNYDCTSKEKLQRAKQWLKDNPKEQPMINERKIEALELELQLNDSNLDNAKLNHSIKQTAIQAEIEELKKPKYELFVPTKNDSFCFMQDSGTVSTHRELDQSLEYSGGIYNWFEVDKSAECNYYAKQRQIFDALANFAAHNDPTEKDIAWNGLTKHWHIKYNKINKTYYINYTTDNTCLSLVCFSSFELAEFALQMLKDERLI